MTKSCGALFVGFSVLGMIVMSVAAVSAADRTADEQTVRTVLEKYVESMRRRDIDGVKSCLHTSFTAVEVGNDGSAVEVVDPTKSEKLLPPEGNKDWEKITFTDIHVQVSPTTPSIAMVSYVAKMKMDEREWKAVQENKSLLEERAKKDQVDIEQIFKDGCANVSMFALMAKKKGEWKIVCMTFPH